MKFRKDINGLRAVAVMAVVFFHFNPNWMPGGFVGVDVFFVISGFLMTAIIFRGVEKGDFSILRFYVARANRIIPALAVLCLVLLFFGWFFLTPLDYKELAKHSGSSIGFISNIVYWQESGYFDAVSHEKWLLHTWSVSAEWQFYIIYPLLIIAAKSLMSLKAAKKIIFFGTIVGFLFCVVGTYNWPDAAYFLLPTRAWEMMIGGVAYLYPLKITDSQKRFFEFSGFSLIVLSCFFVSKESSWPGYLALFPVLGTFLLIQAQRNNSFLTGNFIFQCLGKWSYSIYLWHWPVVVAIYYFSLSDLFVYWGILLSVALGYLSNRYIEGIKFRNNFAKPLDFLKCKPVSFVFFVGVLSSCIFSQSGMEQRFQVSDYFKGMRKELTMPDRGNGYCFYSVSGKYFSVSKEKGVNCYLGGEGSKNGTLLFGDSYAGHNEPFFDEVFKIRNQSLQSVSTNWCVASFSDSFTGSRESLAYKQCLINRDFLKQKLGGYKNLILAGSWDSALKKGQLFETEKVISVASGMGVNVFIMSAPVRYKKNPLNLFYRSFYFGREFDIEEVPHDDDLRQEANKRLRLFSKKYKNVHFVDRDSLYNKSGVFDFGELKVPYSYDGGHISILGSKKSAFHFVNSEKYQVIMDEFDFE